MIRYTLGANGAGLILTDQVLDHFARNKQCRFYQRESGGQLFARFVGADTIIDEATGPRRADWRTRFSYRAHRPAEQREIEARFALGLHYVGDWHTHPEDRPTPSDNDLQTIADIANKSEHALNGLILIIVGKMEFPEGLFVGITRGHSVIEQRDARFTSRITGTAAVGLLSYCRCPSTTPDFRGLDGRDRGGEERQFGLNTLRIRWHRNPPKAD
jgi:integrative and conjugative element protein (TIGR02256 family)